MRYIWNNYVLKVGYIVFFVKNVVFSLLVRDVYKMGI